MGFTITTESDGDIDVFSSKYINEIDNNSQPLEDWISENINEKRRSFFEIIFTEVFTKIKKMYDITNDSIFRIGYTPEIHEALKKHITITLMEKKQNNRQNHRAYLVFLILEKVAIKPNTKEKGIPK